MNEAFLHYLWQYRLFDTRHLKTKDGLSVEIVNPGHYNTDSGPDFFNAQVRLDGTLWAGNVEIHLRSSDWQRHGHHLDAAYDNCILHAVHEWDTATLRKDGTAVPTIELNSRFPAHLWENYLALLGTQGWVPCEHRLREIDRFTMENWLDRLLVERLEQKTRQILQDLTWNRNDWQETFYQHLARNFGFKINALPFELVARTLPLKYISRHRDRLFDVEALLFGQAGLLEGEFHDSYPISLITEYRHLARTYHLKAIQGSGWKYLRLRPSNFPTIRIAQFAKLLSGNDRLFSSILEVRDVAAAMSLFSVSASEYWLTHFLFDKPAEALDKKLGRASIENILVNTVVPFLFAWGIQQGNDSHRQQALDLLEKIPAEDNHFIRNWEEAGVTVKSAFHSQALLQLKLLYCTEKKCLSCAIGNKLINSLP